MASDTEPTSPVDERIDSRRGSCIDDNINLVGPINKARSRPYHIPRHVSQSYPIFKSKQTIALKIACQNLEKELGPLCCVEHIVLEEERLVLILHDNSQSKLSQQELSDLQKATHFDKKELQQWYKGAPTHTSPDTCA